MTSQSEHILSLLPEYLAGRLSPDQESGFHRHLDVCDDCRKEVESATSTWKLLGSDPDPLPDASVRRRFYATLLEHRANHVPDTASWTAMFRNRPGIVRRLALFAAVFLAGFGISWLALRTPGTGANAEQEIAELRGEVHAMHGMLAVSLMQQQNASERLRGIQMTASTQTPDVQILDALMQSLNYDANVNVRLAALDALQEHIDQAPVRAGLILSLRHQRSPLVQLGIIDLLVRNQVRQSDSVMTQMLKNKSLDHVVRSRLQLAVKQLL